MVGDNKVYIATKMLPFQVNYGKEPRIGFDIRKKGKNEKAEEFAKEMKERHEEARVALVRSQEEMKRQIDRSRKEAEEYRVGDKVLISTKDFSMELMKRVIEKFIGPYVVRKIVSENIVELELPVSLWILWRIKMKKGKEMKLNSEAEEFRRGELSERYTAKLLYGWDDKKFDEEYWKKLERNWNRWKKERKEGEKEYMKKLEESLEWNKKDK